MNRISAIPTSIYDRSGMIRVPQMTRDFAPTSNGSHGTLPTRERKKLDAADHDFFESELARAERALEQNSAH